jgi:hypothetical protein
MPLTGGPLPANLIQKIGVWLDEGALFTCPMGSTYPLATTQATTAVIENQGYKNTLCWMMMACAMIVSIIM